VLDSTVFILPHSVYALVPLARLIRTRSVAVVADSSLFEGRYFSGEELHSWIGGYGSLAVRILQGRGVVPSLAVSSCLCFTALEDRETFPQSHLL